MAAPLLVRRVEILEAKVEILSDLPQRMTAVESNGAALRSEMRDGFARVDARFEQVDARLAKVEGELVSVRREIREGDEETRRQMRVLHEDVIGRLALIQEHVSETRRPDKSAQRGPGKRR